MYKQGDIVAVHYPLTDKPVKTKLRPALIVSNDQSNSMDNDVLVCPLTTRIRNSKFSYQIINEDLTLPLPKDSEVRCNKIMTIRVWNKQIIGKLSQVSPEVLSSILNLVRSVFK